MCLQIRAAMAFAMVAVERKFSAAGISSGATCTLILQTGWLLSVANLGDSTAYLDTGREVMRLTADHRVDESAPEQDRLKAFAPRFSVRRLAANMQGFARDGEGVGPLRLWPGGLAVR